MSNKDIPFNISLLNLTNDMLVGMKPVRSLDIFDGATKNFHEDGLFSISIFGKVGEERRVRRYSFIDIKASIFHPVIYRALLQMKRLYGEIISGETYAVWDEETKDFQKSSVLDGQTGFQFFRNHWRDLVFEQRPSEQREQNITLLGKYKDKAMISKILVMPAGLRDFEIDADGRQAEDEINTLYRKLLALSNSVSVEALKNNPAILNTISVSLQNTYNQIYDLLENSIKGKKKLMMGKWASRKVFNGTRNVITAMNPNSKELESPGNVKSTDTIIGLYQFLKGCLPVARHNIRTGFLSKVFPGPNQPAFLVNKNTLKMESVLIDHRYHDAWMSDEGLEKVITSFNETEMRHRPLQVEGRYLGLIYKGPDGTYKLMQDIDDLPSTRSKDDVHPLTFCELLYLSVYKTANEYPIFVTRYPITGIGSVYASMVFLKPTIITEVRSELNDEWTLSEDRSTAYQFPKINTSFVDSLSPSSVHLSRLDADYDGDTMSGNIAYSDEAKKEAKKYLASTNHYIGTDGKLNYSADTDTVKYVMVNMTGTPIDTNP